MEIEEIIVEIEEEPIKKPCKFPWNNIAVDLLLDLYGNLQNNCSFSPSLKFLPFREENR